MYDHSNTLLNLEVFIFMSSNNMNSLCFAAARVQVINVKGRDIIFFGNKKKI